MKILKESILQVAHWPWPKMDIENVCFRAHEGDIYMPNIGYVKIDKENAWHVELGEAANSKRLWINSLVTSHALLKLGRENNNVDYLSLSAEILKSYFRHFDSESGIFIDAWKDEHAVANRLFVLTAFLVDSLVVLGDAELISQVELLHLAERHANWLSINENYVKNNHGVMMDLALAQFGLFIKKDDQLLAERYIKTALDRLDMMFDLTFDSNGCCTENSPSYHFVNYSLFSAIHQFLKKNDLPINSDKWVRILKKALQAGNLLMRPDKTIPVIGDSEKKIGTFFPYNEEYQSDFGVGYYPDAGFFVAKSRDFQFTLRAGGRSFSHKHIDDLSVTLWAGGADFIVDAGLYNYDIKDKMRRWFISARAHSLFYLESIGDVRFANFESPAGMSRFLKMDCDNGGFNVRASHNLSKEAVVTRNVSYTDFSILIEDDFSSEILQKWRFQLLLHPDVSVEDNGDSLILRNGNKEISIKNLGDKNHIFSQENSYYSDSFMSIKPTKMLVLKGQGYSAGVRCLINFSKL